jgi:Flp pilus assembly protein TadG
MPVKTSITFNCLLQWIKQFRKQEKGAVAIIVALSLLVLIGFGALAVDLGYVMMVKNEVQNAADAGALAGAGDLYLNDGTAVNPAANQTAYDTATANQSQKETVFLAGAYTEDVQRGHWSFATRTFTSNDSLTPVDLWNASTSELDANTEFINAVRVRVRTNTPIMSFLSRIWGGSSFFGRAEAVGYIGFAGSLRPRDVDQPMAICKQSILNNAGEYDCTVGRMLNSGGNQTTHNTAGWTNFSQPCETANANEMNSLVCASGNPRAITLGDGMGATGGVQDVTLRNLHDCMWNNASLDTDGNNIPDQPWNMTLPVIDCTGNNVSNCAVVKGAVNISIVWIAENANDPVPRKMGNWTCPAGYTEAQCWTSFTTYFNLKDVDNNTPAYAKKSIYFLPSCTPHEPAGNTGGENFGILAKIPVLVK